MILADKIMALRKKAGWSQEELAARLNISRQSVSKWEGAQSIPDMDKVVQMSRLFGVTTDFLLKDELEIEEHTQSEPMDEPPLRRVTMEEASAYLALRRAAAPKMALATFLCIISPVALLILAAMSDELVCHIADWSLNNQIRKDRYKPSIYQDLLSAAVNGNQRLTDGQPNGNQRSTQSSLGKVSSVEVSSVEDSGGLQGRPPDADTREVAFAPSDADEIDFETKRQIALKRMRESYGQGL